MHLADYMRVKKLADDDVADAIGRNRTTINRIRRGLQRPDWDTIDLLREYSGGAIKADDFVR